MKRVAKLVVIDKDDQYLLMWRSDHPTFPNDPDLPGGTIENGEQPREAMVREVEEEAGITIDGNAAIERYTGTDYSGHGTEYTLYTIQLDYRPDITISWEHDSYEWLERDAFMVKTANASDTYMQMVAAVLGKEITAL